MKKEQIIKSMVLVWTTGLALLTCGCSESLEDTYKDYASDGSIRYLGRCKDIEIQPGWERLMV